MTAFPRIALVLVAMSCTSLVEAAPRSVAALVQEYDKGLAAKGYLPTGLAWDHFRAPQGNKRLSFGAKKGQCYKLVVLADDEGKGVLNNDTVVKWGPLAYQKARGERKLMSGDAFFDLGCGQTGVVLGQPLHEALEATLELVRLDEGSSTFSARLYAKQIGEAEADAQWASLAKKEMVAERQLDGVMSQCGKWHARFRGCVAGKRPGDYLKGASCRAAAEHERNEWGAASCGPP